jgi:hypothetical protein
MRTPKPVRGSGKYPVWRWGLTPEDHILQLEILYINSASFQRRLKNLARQRDREQVA